jgi:hypothetical protein
MPASAGVNRSRGKIVHQLQFSAEATVREFANLRDFAPVRSEQQVALRPHCEINFLGLNIPPLRI